MYLNMEVRVGWEDIKGILRDKSVIPTGRFNENVVHIVDENDSEWWKFPIEKYGLFFIIRESGLKFLSDVC